MPVFVKGDMVACVDPPTQILAGIIGYVARVRDDGELNCQFGPGELWAIGPQSVEHVDLHNPEHLHAFLAGVPIKTLVHTSLGGKNDQGFTH